MNEIFNYSQLMAEPQVETCREKKRVQVQIHIVPALKSAPAYSVPNLCSKGLSALQEPCFSTTWAPSYLSAKDRQISLYLQIHAWRP